MATGTLPRASVPLLLMRAEAMGRPAASVAGGAVARAKGRAESTGGSITIV